MANNEVNYGLSYHTYVSESVIGVENCSKIAFFDYNSLTDNDLSLSTGTIKECFEYLKENSLCVISEKTDDFFLYDSKYGGFNTLIYLSENEKPQGYTTYSNIQGSKNDVKVKLSFEINYKTLDNCKIVNSLTEIIRNNDNRDFTGDELYNFTGLKVAIESLPQAENNFRYTSYLNSVLNSPDRSKCISLGNNFVFKEENIVNYVGFNLLNNIVLDEKLTGFDQFQVGFYNSDVVLYSWCKNEEQNEWRYYIRSILKTNKYGIPIIYTKSYNGYFVIKEEGVDKEIEDIVFCANKYIICKIKNEDDFAIFDSTINKWLDKKENFNTIINSEAMTNDVICYVPNKIKQIKDINNYIPDLLNTKIITEKYLAKNTVELIRRIDNWFILKEYDFFTGNYKYLFANHKNSICVTEDEVIFNKVHVLNSQVLIVDDENKYTFYGLDDNTELDTVYYSNKAKQVFKISEEEKGNIVEVKKDSLIKDGILEKFRRNMYPENLSSLPEILCSFCGLIFYREDNLLKVL